MWDRKLTLKASRLSIQPDIEGELASPAKAVLIAAALAPFATTTTGPEFPRIPTCL
jgi:hypothetical protein